MRSKRLHGLVIAWTFAFSSMNFGLLLSHSPQAFAQEIDDDFFERQIRPLLIARCYECHSGEERAGGLQLDSRPALLQGGESGGAIVPGEPPASLLIAAVHQRDGLEMPPDGRLSASEISALEMWIAAGAPWPNSDSTPAPIGSEPATENELDLAGNELSDAQPIAPSEHPLAAHLQLWLSAAMLPVSDGELVVVWPDQSGRGRDVSATRGVRRGGVGLPGKFVERSTLMGRPAVRFQVETGYASSPDDQLPLIGDAALSIVMVMNLQPHSAQPPYDGVLGIGNPAFGSDPGRPLAALVQINQLEDHALHFAGGWNHDASLGSGSFRKYYHQPLILTIVKPPGSLRSATSIFINGELVSGEKGERLLGTEAALDLMHRTDIGTYLGKALEWCGSIQGDVGEVLVFDAALSHSHRRGLETFLADQYGLVLESTPVVQPATFSDSELSWWAWQPMLDYAVPEVETDADAQWIHNDLDRLVLSAMRKRQLKPSAAADRLTLIRRATFDLTGLPPTVEEIDAFLADESEDAFAKVVDRLLESPSYGERWGRHWLDVVRYAETTANDANAVMRFAWRYRNYVIEALNNDLPYDQFLIEQLAGDLLPPSESAQEQSRRIIATGYLMIGPKALAETDKEQSRLDIVDDQIDVTGRAMLGLTLSCARCHDHKFDPIRASDYYALAGIFRSIEPFADESRNATMWTEFPVSIGEGLDPIQVMAPRESLPRNLRVHVRGNRFTLGALVPRGTPALFSAIHGPIDADSVFERGAEVDREIQVNSISSGRLELARWLTDPQHPLTARVMVNRIWQHHFGVGIVGTSDNFGTRGSLPSHPEILDWLALRFVESGWSIKSMHRLILLSSTWQQSTQRSAEQKVQDPEGIGLAGFRRRRLSAEEMRDSMLAVAGHLDPTPGTNESGEFLFERGEEIGAAIRPNRVGTDDPFYDQFRKRSIYLPIVRNMLPDLLALFDAADPNGVTSVRNETVVASQSLFLMNSPFVREQAQGFSERLSQASPASELERVRLAYRIAYGRRPSEVEESAAVRFIKSYVAAVGEAPEDSMTVEEGQRLAWQSFCQSLLCSNEFAFVD